MILQRFRPRLRTLLFIANLTVLLLPIGGIVLLNLYESQLVKQTESALIGQGAILVATYRQEILERVTDTEAYLRDKPEVVNNSLSGKLLTPIQPELDVEKSEILPPAPSAVASDTPADKIALAAGESLRPIIRDTQRITLAGIRLVDHNGIVVSSSGTEWGLSLSNRKEVSTALTGSHISLLRQRMSDEPQPTLTSLSRKAWLRVFTALPVIEENRVLGAVVLSRSPLGVGKALYHIRGHLFKTVIVILFLLFTVSILTTLAITLPIKSLIDQADMVRKGEREATRVLETPGTVEVEQLSHSIAEMARSLAARSEYIRIFAQNVSHEFKTPLTSLKGSVELLHDHSETMPRKERQRFLANMEADIHKLTRMVNRLLELAKADMSHPSDSHCTVNETIDTLKKRYETRNVEFSFDEDLPLISMDCDILCVVLSNLIDNSLQHGGDDVAVHVLVKKDDSGKVAWTVKDNGRGISEANKEKIFRPFFTTARDTGGTGLGLSIVQSLLDVHKATIELISPEKGIAFRVIT